MAQRVKFADEQPDFMVRSVLVIAPGKWRMRNGHTAVVKKLLELPYKSGTRSRMFPVWSGRCLECNCGMTWNINGTYAAVGKSPYDILGRK